MIAGWRHRRSNNFPYNDVGFTPFATSHCVPSSDSCATWPGRDPVDLDLRGLVRQAEPFLTRDHSDVIDPAVSWMTLTERPALVSEGVTYTTFRLLISSPARVQVDPSRYAPSALF
jgi:hypothetical protein